MTYLQTVDTILFDLDGTLTDSKLGIVESIKAAMVGMKRPLSPHTNLDACIGPPLRESFARLLNTTDPDLVNQAVALYRERYGTKGLYENEMYPNIPELLSELKGAGYRLFVATSKPKFYADKIIAHFGLSQYFEHVYGCKLNGELRHKPDLIRHILQQEQLSPTQTIMIGDRKHDILGAKANGLRAAGVTYGYGHEDELLSAGADWIFHKPNDVLLLFVEFA